MGLRVCVCGGEALPFPWIQTTLLIHLGLHLVITHSLRASLVSHSHTLLRTERTLINTSRHRKEALKNVVLDSDPNTCTNSGPLFSSLDYLTHDKYLCVRKFSIVVKE